MVTCRANIMNPGSIVRCRNRDWVLLPSGEPDVHHLRPLTGAMDDLVAVHRQLSDLVGSELPEERLLSATFPLPTPDDVADAAGAHLLWQAARLTLREGATPFRSLGRPNRLEQREGRVDRYGQSAPVVRAVRYFCPDSPADGVVLDVLLNKAREIHKVLGTHVPVPDDGETVTQALLNALFLRRVTLDEAVQLTFDLGGADEQVAALHRRWDRDVERERINRTRFAQRAIKPEVVQRELEAADEVLGDPDAVRRFVLDTGRRLRLGITADRRADVFRVPLDTVSRESMPPAVRFALPPKSGAAWRVSFTSPTPDGAEYLGRNHPFVGALARFLMEEALEKGSAATAVRCDVVRTRAVPELRMILLLRVRYLLQQPDRATLLSEEVWVRGAAWVQRGAEPEWLPDDEALRLLAAVPDANVPPAEKRELVTAGLAAWPELRDGLRAPLAARADTLRESHARVRRAAGRRLRELSVVPQHPPDLLGMLLPQPVV